MNGSSITIGGSWGSIIVRTNRKRTEEGYVAWLGAVYALSTCFPRQNNKKGAADGSFYTTDNFV